MLRLELSAEVLKTRNLQNQYSEHFDFNEDQRYLELKNLTIRVSIFDILQTFGVVNGNKEADLVSFKNCSFEEFDFDYVQRYSLVDCIATKKLKFRGEVREVELMSCDFSDAQLTLAQDIQSFKMSATKLRYLRTYSRYDSSNNQYEYNLQHLVIDSNSSVGVVKGFHNILRANSYTITEFSLDSNIVNDAESHYRILRANAKKLGDGVQSDILYSKILALHSRKADSDGKVLLFFEEFSNHFGQSFLLPLMWMVLINGFFVMILQMTHQIPYTGFWNFSINTLNINPLHQLFNPEDFNPSSTLVGIDSVRRLILAALAYQVISGARRYSPSKK